MTAIVRLYLPRDRAVLQAHFAALTGDDLRDRFCAATKRESVTQFLYGLGAAGVPSYGIYDGNLALAAVCQLGLCGEELEVGLTVLAAHRRKGFATALLNRSASYARARGIKALIVHCLAGNTPMLSLARGIGMAVESASGQADGRLTLRAGTVLDFWREISYEQHGVADTAAKYWQLCTQMAAIRQ